MSGATETVPRPPPGLLRRGGAIAYDVLIVIALSLVVVAILVAFEGEALRPRAPWPRVLSGLTTWLYFCWSWTHGGQTIGMRAWRIVVTSTNGRRVGWRRATLRFLAAIVSALPLGLGFLWALIDRERRCWHDMISATRIDAKR